MTLKTGNDAENSALNHRNKLHFKIEKSSLNISFFYCILNQINATLMIRKETSSKNTEKISIANVLFLF